MLLLTLRGTPTCYYGDEIGMHDVKIPPEKVQDPPAVNNPESADTIGRDPERTPMQWDASPNAGFCPADVEPWLPVADDYAERNVAAQEDDPTSMLNFYRALTALRAAEPALHVGDYAPVDVDAEELYVYTRAAPDADDFLVVLNFGDQPHILNMSAVASQAEITLATDMIRSGAVTLAELAVAPNEGLVLRCEEGVL
jgi:alpha-glucosidase